MREGRRKRLGLQEGTEGTVEDTYLDRILEQEGPRTLSLDPDAFVDTTDQRYVQDAYNYYLGGGTGEVPVVDDGGGGGQATLPGFDDPTPEPISRQTLPGFDVDSPKNTDFEQSLLDQGIGVQGAIGDPVVAPGEIPVTQQEMDDFNAIPVTQPSFDDQFQDIEDIQQTYGTPINIGFGEGQVDPGLAAGLEGPIVDTSPVTPTITAPSGDVFAAGDPLAEEKIDFTPEQQGLIDQAFSKVGSTAGDIMNDLSQIPGAVVDFANQTVDIFGQKINVGKTLLSAGINKIVGGPISLVFDLLGGLPKDSLENTTKRSITDELSANNYGYNMQSGNIGQDPFGRNPISAFGDYEQTLAEDATYVGDSNFSNAKKQYAEDYFNAKSERAGGVEQTSGISEEARGTGVVSTRDVLGPGEFLPEGEDLVSLEDQLQSQPATSSPTLTQAQSTANIDAARGGGGGSSGTLTQAQSTANIDAARGQTGGGNQGGGGKIVCTMMNDSYGFGSFRNKIWLKHSKDLAPEYQIGYHKIFLPLVKLSKTNKIVRKTLEHIAVHRTIDIRQEARGKVHLLGRIYRKILEPICYIVGKHAKR